MRRSPSSSAGSPPESGRTGPGPAHWPCPGAEASAASGSSPAAVAGVAPGAGRRALRRRRRRARGARSGPRWRGSRRPRARAARRPSSRSRWTGTRRHRRAPPRRQRLRGAHGELGVVGVHRDLLELVPGDGTAGLRRLRRAPPRPAAAVRAGLPQRVQQLLASTRPTRPAGPRAPAAPPGRPPMRTRPGASAGPAATVAAQLRRPSPRCCTRSNSVHSGQVGTCTSRLGAAATAARKAVDRSSISRSRSGKSTRDVYHRAPAIGQRISQSGDGSRTPSAHAISQYATTTGNLTARIALHAYGTNPQGWFAWLDERSAHRRRPGGRRRHRCAMGPRRSRRA